MTSFESTMEELIEIVRQSFEKVCFNLNAYNNIDFGDNNEDISFSIQLKQQ